MAPAGRGGSQADGGDEAGAAEVGGEEVGITGQSG
jgi:hypothetical protein